MSVCVCILTLPVMIPVEANLDRFHCCLYINCLLPEVFSRVGNYRNGGQKYCMQKVLRLDDGGYVCNTTLAFIAINCLEIKPELTWSEKWNFLCFYIEVKFHSISFVTNQFPSVEIVSSAFHFVFEVQPFHSCFFHSHSCFSLVEFQLVWSSLFTEPGGKSDI